MSARNEGMRGGARLRLLLASMAALIALLLLAPGRLNADWKSCVDESFVQYNSCLMDAGGWFERKLCDLDWEFDVALCTARAVGEIRDAWNGDNIR